MFHQFSRNLWDLKKRTPEQNQCSMRNEEGPELTVHNLEFIWFYFHLEFKIEWIISLNFHWSYPAIMEIDSINTTIARVVKVVKLIFWKKKLSLSWAESGQWRKQSLFDETILKFALKFSGIRGREINFVFLFFNSTVDLSHEREEGNYLLSQRIPHK